MKRLTKLLITLFSIGCLISFYILHFWAPKILLVPNRISNQEASVIHHQFEDELKIIPLNIRTEDSLNLSAYFIEAALESEGTFIICHGIGSCKEHQLWKAKWLNELGYNVLVFDSRAHGQSGGEYCTYGYMEKQDISSIMNLLEQKREKDFYIWGSSLGGAVALQALEYDKRLKGGIIHSTFANLNEIALDYQSRITGVDWEWLRDYTTWRSGEIVGFDIRKIQPENSCNNITQPVFIAHGDKDVHISIRYGERNYSALSSKSKQFYTVEGADHNNLWSVGGEGFQKVMEEFVLENFK